MTANYRTRFRRAVGEPGRNKPLVRYSLWIVQGLLALLFLFTGGTKLLMPLAALTSQTPVPMSGLFVRFLGVAEVLGALGLVIPGLLHRWTGLTAFAAAGLALIMVGATVLTLVGGGGVLALIPLVVGLLAAFVVYGRSR